MFMSSTGRAKRSTKFQTMLVSWGEGDNVFVEEYETCMNQISMMVMSSREHDIK